MTAGFYERVIVYSISPRARGVAWHPPGPCKPSGTSPLSSLPLVVRSVKEEIRPFGDCVDTARGLMLGWLKNSFK